MPDDNLKLDEILKEIKDLKFLILKIASIQNPVFQADALLETFSRANEK